MKNLLPDVRQAMRAAVLGVATATTALPIMDAFFNTQTSTVNAQNNNGYTQNNFVFVEGVRQTLLDDSLPWIRLSTAIALNAGPSMRNQPDRIKVGSETLKKSMTLWNDLNSTGFIQLGLDNKIASMDCLLSHIVLASRFNYNRVPNASNNRILGAVQGLYRDFYRESGIKGPQGCRGVYARIGLN
jgi:hypothetical protein